MTESLSISNAQVKRVPIQDRSYTINELTGINGYLANRTLLKQRFAEGGYLLQETPHFLLFTRTAAPSTILVHWIAPEEIDADIGNRFMQELKPLGLISDAQHFGQVFGVVVCSLFPHNPQQALHLYATNTLQRYRSLLTETNGEWNQVDSPIHAFAAVYRRVFQLCVGERFLDAGCSFGFLPLLIAEHFPYVAQVVGIDIETESFPIVQAIAEKQQLKHVHFTRADLLAEDFSSLGMFDTVTAIHILEHFTESEMYRVLTNLLQITSQRLLLAVPYEPGEPEIAYGHKQLFSREKLEAAGMWCLQQLEGPGRIAYEDCAGGLLLIERRSSEDT
jgi:2-polyprenyl-3-methyl-5-hydroxy-6-metoxy-1,4-benzoquinol methylase